MKNKKEIIKGSNNPDLSNIDKPTPKKIAQKKIAYKRRRNKVLIWTVKVTIITFLLAIAFSLLAESVGILHYAVSIILLILLIVVSLIADAVGIAATSCEPEPIYSMASRREPYSKQAILIVKNAEIVSNICCDVIGDICGILSGSLLMSIVIILTINSENNIKSLVYILFSGIIASLMVGGKSLFKTLAVNKSKEIVLMTAKFIAIFYRPKDNVKKQKKK